MTYYTSSNDQFLVRKWGLGQAPIGGVYTDNESPIDSWYIEEREDPDNPGATLRKKVYPNAYMRAWFITPERREDLVKRLTAGIGDHFKGLEESGIFDTSKDILKREHLMANIDGTMIPLVAFLNMVCMGWDLQERSLFDQRTHILGMDAPTTIAWDDTLKQPVPVCVPKRRA